MSPLINQVMVPKMLNIDVGDLALFNGTGTKQHRLFKAIQQKVVRGLWPNGGKLPSTRQLSSALNISRNTVVLAYDQLMAEGYIESQKGSGFYVAVTLPEQHILTEYIPMVESHEIGLGHNTSNDGADAIKIQAPTNDNAPFAPGIPDLAQFPHKVWQKLMQRHADRQSLLGSQNIQGDAELRMALAGYLASSRSVYCTSQRIIITSGAQQALSIALLATLKRNESILVEDPGYTQMCKITDLFNFDRQIAPVYECTGLDINTVLKSNAKALYVTPSNQYPLGTTLNIEQRLQLIKWAQERQTWLVEDDYDSEFQFAHQPYPCMQGLANQMGFEDRILYVGSFSKVMFNGLRIGYLVVPDSLIGQCLSIKEALSGDTPTHTQAALADFIRDGHLLRHIRKMRRLYKSKYLLVVDAIHKEFGGDLEVVSQAAGIHVTLKWTGGISENRWQNLAAKSDIILRPLNYYEQPRGSQVQTRQWSGAVLGFGNVAAEQISEKIALLAKLFYQPS